MYLLQMSPSLSNCFYEWVYNVLFGVTMVKCPLISLDKHLSQLFQRQHFKIYFKSFTRFKCFINGSLIRHQPMLENVKLSVLVALSHFLSF